MELVVKRIPKEMFEKVYKIQLPETYTASELLQIYSGHLGYVTGRGLPDENKAARIMLRDYNNGKILFVNLRPDYDKEKHGKVIQSNVDYTLKVEDSSQLEESKGEATVEEDKTEQSEDIHFLASNVNTNDTQMIKTKKVEKEQQFDQQFFNSNIKQQKLNKSQKRAIKFAVKRGEDPKSVDLNNPQYSKGKGKRRIGDYSEVKQKSGNTSNKVFHFSKLELE
jgi:large subunit GTPase 1